MFEKYEMVMKRIEAWWYREIIDRACIRFIMPRPNYKAKIGQRMGNSIWSSSDKEPELEERLDLLIEMMRSKLFFGEILPTIPHAYNNRGSYITMIMAAYLGGKPHFMPNTVWYEPIIEDWHKFDIRFNPENVWWKKSLKLFETTARKSRKIGYFPGSPDYGDALTVFSLLRGAERLIFDIMDNREVVVAARDKFLKALFKYYQIIWKMYHQNFPGGLLGSWWAPGKMWICQCDFSAALSPAIFTDLVVPEIEKMGEHMEYIFWHLDGPDEIKYLDILFDLPEIKGIEWVPGAGQPTAVHWIPMLKRIQARKKNLFIYADNEEEVRILLTELSSRGLFISGGFTGKTMDEAKGLLRMVEKLSSSQ